MSPEEPDPPESLVCTWGLSMTLGDLMMSKAPSSPPLENRTERGDTSTLMTGHSRGILVEVVAPKVIYVKRQCSGILV